MTSRSEEKLLAYFGHHKAATTWVHSIISSVCNELGFRHAIVHNPNMFKSDLQAFVNDKKVDFLSYTNADYDFIQTLSRYIGFHVIRDPRDVCVSAYYSHMNSHPLDPEYWPQLEKIRLQLHRMNKDEGLALEIELYEWQANQLRNWNFHDPNLLEIKMERLVANPYQYFLEIFGFLNLLDDIPFSGRYRSRHLANSVIKRITPNYWIASTGFSGSLPPERLLGIVWEHDFQQKSGGRKRGEENIGSHYRKGEPGDWKNHFTAEHIDLFKSKYNDLLIQLGYESVDDW